MILRCCMHRIILLVKRVIIQAAFTVSGMGKRASVPTEEYFRISDRNIDMINKYNPDLVYYDDTRYVVPVSDVGLSSLHFYNKSIADNNGEIMPSICKDFRRSEKQSVGVAWVPDQIQDKPGRPARAWDIGTTTSLYTTGMDINQQQRWFTCLSTLSVRTGTSCLACL